MIAFRAAKSPSNLRTPGPTDIKNDVVDYLIWCVDAKSGWIAAAQIGDRIPFLFKTLRLSQKGDHGFITYIIQFLTILISHARDPLNLYYSDMGCLHSLSEKNSSFVNRCDTATQTILCPRMKRGCVSRLKKYNGRKRRGKNLYCCSFVEIDAVVSDKLRTCKDALLSGKESFSPLVKKDLVKSRIPTGKQQRFRGNTCATF